MWGEQFNFIQPGWLWGLLSLPLLALWYYRKDKIWRAALRLNIPDELYESTTYSWHRILYLLRLLAVASLFIAMARPQTHTVSTKTKTHKGIDIVMAIDVSASMMAKDLRPNRLEALKKVAERFVNKRPNDRIGIVVYAGESFTKTPVTSDKEIVIRGIRSLHWGEVEGGTAIGMGLGTAVNRLKETQAKSKVIILLTDGVNNAGFIDPVTAAEIAKELGIKVYTIGIGTNGYAPFPVAKRPDGSLVFQDQKVEIDEALLKKIAKITGGKYFRATSNTKLKTIYEEINRMEKTKIDEFKYYQYEEHYRFWVWLALILLFLEKSLQFTVFKSVI